MKLKMNGMRLAALPHGKTAVDVFGDFLSYLFRCTRSFIIDTHANGHGLWNAVEPNIQFVLSHPNGWEGAQQYKMRRAAVYGGLIPDTDEGRSRIRFVTEGEASLHACVLNGLAQDVLSVSSPVSGLRIAREERWAHTRRDRILPATGSLAPTPVVERATSARTRFVRPRLSSLRKSHPQTVSGPPRCARRELKCGARCLRRLCLRQPESAGVLPRYACCFHALEILLKLPFRQAQEL